MASQITFFKKCNSVVNVMLNLSDLSNDHGNGKKARSLGYVHTTG